MNSFCTLIGHSPWWRSYVTLVAYICFSFLYSYIPYSQPVPHFDISDIPMLGALFERSIHPNRMIFYWQCMLMSFPLVFVIFCIVTPVNIGADFMSYAEVTIGCLFAIIVFGFLVTPVGIYVIFFTAVDGNHALDRILSASCSSQFYLAISGAALLVPFCVLFWISYTAPVVALVKASRN